MTVLITAGPTIEDIDPVRFISNRASGRLGVEVARAALRKGHRVVLIHGPISASVQRAIPASPRITTVPVRSAADMRRAVMRHVSRADVVVMNAAVADYTPARVSKAKLKKSARILTLRLRPTVDILAELGRLKRRRRNLALIGFALESGPRPLAEGRRKLRAKNLDAVIVDSPRAMGAKRASFTVIRRDGAQRRYGMSKSRFARVVVALAEKCAAS